MGRFYRSLTLAAVCAAFLAAQTRPPASRAPASRAPASRAPASRAPASRAPAPAPAKPAVAPPAASPEPGLYATISTTMGDIVIQLFEKQAPATVKNFVDLASGAKAWPDPATGLPRKQRFYDGIAFHRVIPGFMIQGGDPLGDGTGDTKVVPDEINPMLKFDQPGRVGMANSGPNTSSCQFFITEAPQPHLDGLHTIFGQVVSGQEVVSKIARVPTKDDKPLTPVKIVSVTTKRILAPAAK